MAAPFKNLKAEGPVQKVNLPAKHCPDLLRLPSTNGEHDTGDGIKMGEAAGTKSTDLEEVQVYLTGLVKPDDPDAKIDFLDTEDRSDHRAILGAQGRSFGASGRAHDPGEGAG
jgi:succinate dehydrogenase/fumarate reductase flavoprotein subunit